MKVVVFGATGVTGRAAAERFASLAEWSVFGVSRRPADVDGVVHVPALMSTIKLRQAGFGECIDTEDMFRQWLAIYQQRRLIP